MFCDEFCRNLYYKTKENQPHSKDEPDGMVVRQRTKKH
mgnify:CR=1 FL=1